MKKTTSKVQPTTGAGLEAAALLHVEPTPKPGRKMVRGHFTIPEAELAVLQSLKYRSSELGRPAKKSELLRAGIVALVGMNDKSFHAALGKVVLMGGRPLGAVIGLD